MHYKFDEAFQDLILACVVRHPEKFAILGRIVQPQHFIGLQATQVCRALGNYFEKYDHYPTFRALRAYVYEQFRREDHVKGNQALKYVKKIEKISTKDVDYVKSKTIQFARERAILLAVKTTAEHLQSNEWPPEGFATMFEDAMQVGNTLENSGINMMDHATAKIDESQGLLGDYFLSREGVLLVIAPSGVGKSSASFDMAMNWACGKPSFGIKPMRPLRILQFNGEDDNRTITLMTRGVNGHHAFSADEQKLISNNTLVVRQDGQTGEKFLMDVVAVQAKLFNPDLIVINPLNACLGGDPSDAKLVTTFFRNLLTPLLRKRQCGAMVVHHTPKTNRAQRDSGKWKMHDFMYAGAGNADMTNMARAVLTIETTENSRIFAFRAAKGGNNIGWQTKNGGFETKRYFQHNWLKDGHTISHWSEADEVAVAGLKEASKAPTGQELIDLLPAASEEGDSAAGLVSTKQLEAKYKEKGWSRDGARAILKKMVEEGLICRIEGGKGKPTWYGRPEIVPELNNNVGKPMSAPRPGTRSHRDAPRRRLISGKSIPNDEY